MVAFYKKSFHMLDRTTIQNEITCENAMQPDIIALGEPLLEMNAVDEGGLETAGAFQAGFGGDTSNFAVAAARAGGRVGYLTRIGRDAFGDAFLSLWKREGVDVSHVAVDENAGTGLYFITRRDGGHEFVYFRKGSAASRMTPDSLPEEYIAGAGLLHVSGVTQGISDTACDAGFAAMDAARSAGTLVSYDPNLRPALWPLARARAVIHEAMSRADLVFPSIEDARELTGLFEAGDIARFYRELGAKIVVLKLGAEGALLAREDEVVRYPAFRAEAVDCSGAGDAFAGTFAAEYVAGSAVGECMRRALAAGALTVSGLGCVTPIPTRERVDAFLADASPQARSGAPEE